jgi:rifampicin phosphotransferase
LAPNCNVSHSNGIYALSLVDDASAIVLGLGESQALGAHVAGGKFASLARLFQAGVRIPPAFCISTHAFSIMLKRSGCAQLAADLFNFQTKDRNSQSVEFAGELTRRIQNAEIPVSIKNDVRTRLSHLTFPLIVRSSASQEDSLTRSFAGVYESVLGVNSVGETFEAIKECWASLFSAKAIAYFGWNSSKFEGGKMAVINQEMLTPSVGGVALTCDPIKGGSVFSINASFGLPSLLVSGEIAPDLYELGADGATLEKRVGSKRQITEYVNGEVKTRPSTTAEQESYCLSDWQLNEIYQCGKRIEILFGCPQDIEWAFQDNQLYILQSRSITTALERS